MADEAARTLSGSQRAQLQNNSSTTPRRNRENRGTRDQNAATESRRQRHAPRREIAQPSPPPIEYSYGVSPISSEIEELEFPVDVRGVIKRTIYKSPQKIERERKMREEVIVISDDDEPGPSPTRPRPRKKRRLAKEPKAPVEVILIESSEDERRPNTQPIEQVIEPQEMDVDAPMIPFGNPTNLSAPPHELTVHPWSRLTPETDEARLALEREFDEALAALTCSEPNANPQDTTNSAPVPPPPGHAVPHRPLVIVRRCTRTSRVSRGGRRGRGALKMRRATTHKPPRKKTTVLSRAQIASPNPKPVIGGNESDQTVSAPSSAGSYLLSSSYGKTCDIFARAKGRKVWELFREYCMAGIAGQHVGIVMDADRGEAVLGQNASTCDPAAFADGYTPPESPTSDMTVTPVERQAPILRVVDPSGSFKQV